MGSGSWWSLGPPGTRALSLRGWLTKNAHVKAGVDLLPESLPLLSYLLAEKLPNLVVLKRHLQSQCRTGNAQRIPWRVLQLAGRVQEKGTCTKWGQQRGSFVPG